MLYLFTFIIHNALVTLHLHRRIIQTSAAYFPTPYYIYSSPHGKMIGGFKKNSISLQLKPQMPQQVCGT